MAEWRWFVIDYPSGPRVFRLATDGSAVERADGAGWISVPGALERLLTDPQYREVDEGGALMLVPEERRKSPGARSGLKEGAGGHLQRFGQHGKYAQVGADERDAALLIAPVSGSTPRKTVSADLTMSALPTDVRTKALAQMQTSLGVDVETGVQHLVAMGDSAYKHGLPGRLWYSEARRAALVSADRYGIHSDVGVAVVAAMSPGTKWEENLRNAEAVMSMHQQWDQPIDEAHIRNVNVWAAREDKTTKVANSQFGAVKGETLGQLYKKDPHLAAVYAAKKTNASAGYSYDNFFKGMDLVAANDPKVIDRTLNGAKVRSFFNNLSAPTSETGHVTVDIHMQRAISNDLDSTTPQQKHEHLNMIKKRSTALTGSPSYNGASLGAMPVMADVIREATKRFNARHNAHLRPSEFQAVVWTEQITQFPPQTVEAILKAPVP